MLLDIIFICRKEIAKFMSKSKRKTKKHMPGDGCWLCDSSARKKKHKREKSQPDAEIIVEIQK
jgi:hypothetical protein